jgi:CubicO group peptidase (beta-lactamase class C family)
MWKTRAFTSAAPSPSESRPPAPSAASRPLRHPGTGRRWCVCWLAVLALGLGPPRPAAAAQAGEGGQPPPAETVRAALPAVAEPERLQPLEAVPGCGERPLATGEADALPPQTREALARFQAMHKGLGLVVLREGAIIAEQYAPGFGPDSRFQSFSMAKSLMALVMGAAIGEGLMPDEGQPLRRFLAAPGQLGNVPLRAFLTMASGMETFRAEEDPRSRQLIFGPDIAGVALSAALVAPPETRFVYNNASSQVAGEALQQALIRAGRGGYAPYLSAGLWCAIGAAPATLWVEAPNRPRFYMGVNATVRDWARVGQLMFERGRAQGRQIVPKRWLERMAAPSRANSIYGYQVWRGSPHVDRRDYGGGLELVVARAEPFRADDVIFFDGFGGQRVYVVPSARLVIARAGEVDFAFDDSALVNIVLDGLAARQAATAAKP